VGQSSAHAQPVKNSAIILVDMRQTIGKQSIGKHNKHDDDDDDELGSTTNISTAVAVPSDADNSPGRQHPLKCAVYGKLLLQAPYTPNSPCRTWWGAGPMALMLWLNLLI
jgi:hypothetical protein